MPLLRTSLSLGALLLIVAPLTAQRPTVTPSDYGRFENLGAFALDPTGTWLVASIRRVDESDELRLTRADGNGSALVLQHGTRPLFDAEGRWLAYRKGVSPDEREKAEDPIRDRLGLVELATGRDTVLFEVSDLTFRDDGRWLAAHAIAVADTVGADLIVLDPAGGTRTVIGNVETFAWKPDGSTLAATLRTAGGDANGVVLYDPDTGTLRTLDSHDARYRALTWHEDTGALGVLRSTTLEARAEDSHDLLVWADPAGAPRVLPGVGRAELGDTLRIADSGGIAWSDDGGTVFLGVRPWKAKAADADAGADGGASAAPTDAPDAERDAPGDGGEPEEGRPVSDPSAADEVEEANVQVWHWDDDQILRAQEYFATRIANATLTTAWHLEEDRLIVLADDLDEPVDIIEGGRWGLVPDYTPYRFERRFGDGAADWYRVDVRDGSRARVAQGVQHGIDAGPVDGRVLLYQDDRWVAIDLASLARVSIGEPGQFTRSLFDYDFPGPRPPWGVAAWTDEPSRVLLHDKHDVWSADLDTGALERLTDGAARDRQYRVVRMDPDLSFSDPYVVAPDAELWLSETDLHTRASGYARVRPGGAVESLIFEDARVSGLTRAAEADRYAVRKERWDDAPDVFVGDADLRPLRQVTQVNAFQDDYAWGRTELLDYTTDAGHDLQAILVYPADFEEGKRYPLILYQYERLSDGLHRYYTPSQRNYYNYQVWSQQGYFVLMPDIVYEPGRPGPSALDAVEHALDAAVATGHVDPDRMGLIGHSWGGYQAAYLPTRTNRFAASVAGAAITNFLSFMGAVHWNGGLPETGHWETGQARMAVPYWEDLQGHLESSPAAHIQDLETPMLLMHGDADGVVDFRQGLEFYNYARRAGKNVVLLVYPGADHGLREETQQVDYHRRILQWFDHWLKGAPAADWIERGESWEARSERIGPQKPPGR